MNDADTPSLSVQLEYQNNQETLLPVLETGQAILINKGMKKKFDMKKTEGGEHSEF